MRSSWKIAASVVCATVIGGAVITWHLHKAKENERLVEDVRASRVGADHGDAIDELRLGSMYYSGQGLPQDYAEALRWYRKAADQEDAKAQYDIGSMYYDGRGVPQDSAEAVRWYRLAAELGLAKAQ